MLRLDSVHAGYGRAAVLEGVSLCVNEGESVAIVGRNGVGKTTMLRAIAGQIRATRGEVHLAGRSLGALNAAARARLGIAYVPQGREIFGKLTVLENLRVAASSAAGRGWREVVDEVMAEFPVLGGRLHQRGGALSGGQQQLLAIARALATRPTLLLLDEPSEGIQPDLVVEIAELVRDLGQRRGLTVVTVEQNLDCAARLAERAYAIDRGRVVAEVRTRALVESRDLQEQYFGV
jgi:urea ABC transporter ATP-binding protein UrtE